MCPPTGPTVTSQWMEATTMVVVGADVHKRTHTFVAVDEVGRKLGEKVVEATTAGHHQAVAWAREQFGSGLRWGIEDCRHLSARLERDLLTCGQQVVRVPPKLMAQTRSSARTRGKSDPIDALAVARAVLREPDLPVATHDETSRELKMLVDRRADPDDQPAALAPAPPRPCGPDRRPPDRVVGPRQDTLRTGDVAAGQGRHRCPDGTRGTRRH